MNKEQAILDTCIQQIVTSVNWGPLDNWTHSHFENLSERIMQKTGINISSRTLKRLFGKEPTEKQHHPQIETKNAFAQFLGYSNWFDYVSITHKKHTHNNPSTKILFFLTLLIGISAILVMLYKKRNQKPINLSDHNYVFQIDNNSGTIPFSARFNYDFSTLPTDSIFVQYGVMSTKFHLPKDKHTSVYTYKTSGVMSVKLWVDNNITDTLWIYALSPDWETVITGSNNYFPAKSIRQNGVISIPYNEVLEVGNELNKKEFWTKYSLCKDFGISADNLLMEVRLKGDSVEKEILCPDIKIRLIGEHENSVIIHFVPEGCGQYIQTKLSDIHYNGNEKEYPVFLQNVRTWNTIKYKSIHQQVHLQINNDSIQTSYNKKIGKLYVISMSARGHSMIDYWHIFTPEGDTVYAEEFD
jgi:hypothetical protein